MSPAVDSVRSTALSTATSGSLSGATRSWRAAAVRFAPLAFLTTVIVGTAVRDPHRPGSWATCPTLALFGIDCPGCGSLRAVHDATRGDLAGSIGHNALVLPAALFIVYATVRRPGARWSLVWAAAFVTFTLLRNIPGSPLAA